MIVNGNVPPRRLKNAARRPREYLTPAEVKQLIAAAKARPGRHGHRDATMILIAYRHGLRVCELTALRWDMLDFPLGHLHVQRRKNDRPGVRTVREDGVRTVREDVVSDLHRVR
jgi:type 1 fimbriae regulatory protein FimB/type 1 fimbriae regulatory protein FimE